MATAAEAGLKKAKEESADKDSLHLWGEVLSWTQFPELVRTKDRIDQLMNDPKSKVSRGLVYDFMTLKEMKRRFTNREGLRYGAYAALFRYKMGKLAKAKAPPEVLKELIEVYGRYIEGEAPLHIAIQWAVYLNRR